jgi:hypothetical protein
MDLTKFGFTMSKKKKTDDHDDEKKEKKKQYETSRKIEQTCSQVYLVETRQPFHEILENVLEVFINKGQLFHINKDIY